MPRHERVQTEVVNLNTAGLEDLARVPGIDKTQAQAIIAWREQNGPFLNWKEVQQVPGLEDETLLEVLEREAVIQP